MKINKMPLTLEIPFLFRSAAIATFIPSPTYAWASVHLENATAIMNLDGHHFVIDGKTEQQRLRKLLFLSTTKCDSNHMLLEARITGEIKKDVREGNLFDQQVFTELYVSKMRFKATTEILQEKKEAEIFSEKLFKNLMDFSKKIKGKGE